MNKWLTVCCNFTWANNNLYWVEITLKKKNNENIRICSFTKGDKDRHEAITISDIIECILELDWDDWRWQKYIKKMHCMSNSQQL